MPETVHKPLQIPRFARDDNQWNFRDDKNWDFRGNLRRSKAAFLQGYFFFLLVFAEFAVAKSWRVADFNDTISVHEDGSADVHERITIAFVGEWHG